MMTPDNSEAQETRHSRRGAFEFLVEAIAWLQIAASPLLLGLVIGALIYFSNPTTTRMVLGLTVATIGLAVGVIWASSKWKGKGTVWFMSRIMATPELDGDDGKKSSVDSDDQGKP